MVAMMVKSKEIFLQNPATMISDFPEGRGFLPLTELSKQTHYRLC